jgi:hypothetical protein
LIWISNDVEKQLRCVINVWFCEIKLNFIDLEKLKLEK